MKCFLTLKSTTVLNDPEIWRAGMWVETQLEWDEIPSKCIPAGSDTGRLSEHSPGASMHLCMPSFRRSEKKDLFLN